MRTDKDLMPLQQVHLNFGPAHPAAHGVLRLIIEMDGETVERADPHIGLLHRGTEKLLEHKPYLQGLPYLDRLDYVSMMVQEHGLVLALERLVGMSASKRAQYLRVLWTELTRILNHLLAITCHAMDVGALTPFLWAFEERENLLEMYERVSGARMHAAYICFGGVTTDLSQGLVADIYRWRNNFNARLDDLEEVLRGNRIWKQRLIDIGVVSKWERIRWRLSGPLLRASGFAWDLRKRHPYEIYSYLDFRVPVGTRGDSYDRYLIRLSEMRNSLAILNQCLQDLPNGIIKSEDEKLPGIRSFPAKITMENLISHFQGRKSGVQMPAKSAYVGIEAPKGEFGIFLARSVNAFPMRCHIRAPGFVHLQALDVMAREHLLADVVTLIGTQDIVFGEVDR